MMNPEGRVQLTDAVQSAVDELVGRLTEEAGVERDDVLDLVAVGNPIMHHLLLGIDPTPLGTAPFALATDLAVDARATDIGVRCRRARLHVLPCIAGHVGADAAAAILAEGPHRSDEVQLLVDVGTNAEIVLGQRQWLLAASSPTGPALEGAQISCGQRATPGAIERVRIDRDTLEPRIRVVGGDRWSDEEGFEEHLPPAGITGVCGSGIIEVVAELFLAGVLDADGTIDGALAARTARVVEDGRVFAYVLHEPSDGRPASAHHPERRARHPAGQGRAAGRRAAPDGPRRAGVAGRRRLGPAGRCVRQPHRPALRARARPPARLPARPGALGRQRRGLGRRAGPAVRRGPCRDRRRRPHGDQGRDGHRAALPGALRGLARAPHATDPYPNLSKVVQLPERRVAADAGTSRRRRGRTRSDHEERTA